MSGDTGWWWLEMDGNTRFAFMLTDEEIIIYRQHGEYATERRATEAEVLNFRNGGIYSSLAELAGAGLFDEDVAYLLETPPSGNA